MKTQQKHVRVAVFVCLQLVLLMPVANADWFGYKSYGECIRAERKERMDRWFSPMSAKDATIAAQDECHKYREPLNRSADSTRQPSEQEQQARKAREEKMRKFQGPCTWEAYQAGYCTREQNLDYNAQQSIKNKNEYEEFIDELQRERSATGNQ